MEDILIEDGIFDQEFIDLFYDFCVTNNNWFYGRKSSINKETLLWGSILWEPGMYKNFFVEYIFKKFSNKFKINSDILSCVLNGQTYGQDGDWHIDLYTNDDNIDNKYTLLYYVNNIWNDESGSTIIKLDDGVKEYKIDFVPGRLLFFPSKFLHKAEGPKSKNLLRITCAFKLELIGK